jgi:hypothetical protein
MVRIRCNVCKAYKTLKPDTYESMLRRFGFTRSFLFGLTHGIEAVITNAPIQDNISREETEKAFMKVYVCQDCKNKKDETIRVTQSLNNILNISKTLPHVDDTWSKKKKDDDGAWNG